MNHQRNITRIKAVYHRLAELQNQVVFVGGAVTSLYATLETLDTRPTDDVDVLVEIVHYLERAKLEEKLRSIGFQHDIHSTIACRFVVQGITVDVMPTDDSSIGFKNRWYPDGFKQAIELQLDHLTCIRILTAPYFIATKLEAFHSRGGGDGRTSHDFEDIVFVLENRDTIWEEMNEAPRELKDYLVNTFSKLLDNPYLFEWIDCHVQIGTRPATYAIMLNIERLVRGD